ncbi:carbon storage regulator [Salibacterium aidingense]|uniref:carbon storage regulator n=1 Tax=Salibacterium aidingense TaxID=384933 RepID=UPI003BD92D97
MLVLGRKPGEYIIIDDKIKVEVVKSENGHLRLAIDAPKEMGIVRGEVYEGQQTKKVTVVKDKKELNPKNKDIS